MNRRYALSFRVASAAFAASILWSGIGKLHAQATPTPAAPVAKPAPAEENPFAPQPAPVLPPGMTGSTINDPRVGLKPGLYDAGEAAMGLQHVAFLKKPAAFQMAATDPADPEVQKTLGTLGIGDTSKMPKPMQLVIAQLAFANSDFA